MSTISDGSSRTLLESACSSLLAVFQDGKETSPCLFQLFYEQSSGIQSLSVDGNIATFSSPASDLAFSDSCLDPVYNAWKMVMGDSAGDDADYMKFVDREGGDDDYD